MGLGAPTFEPSKDSSEECEKVSYRWKALRVGVVISLHGEVIQPISTLAFKAGRRESPERTKET